MEILKQMQEDVRDLQRIASRIPLRFAHTDSAGTNPIQLATATECLSQGDHCTATLNATGEEVDVIVMDGNAPEGTEFLVTQLSNVSDPKQYFGFGIGNFLWIVQLKDDLTAYGSVEVTRVQSIGQDGSLTLYDPEQTETVTDILGYAGKKDAPAMILFIACQWVFIDVGCTNASP
jgi:hypothetical protein